MAWLAVDKDGAECVFAIKPYRELNKYWESPCEYVSLPDGSIKKLIGRELIFEDEPVELKEE